MADLIDRAALLHLFNERLDAAHIQYCTRHCGKTLWTGIHEGINWGRNTVIEAPAVETIELNLLLRQLYRERTRLYRDDEAFEKRRAGYESSSFIAGFVYALERMVGWATSLEVERRTDA